MPRTTLPPVQTIASRVTPIATAPRRVHPPIVPTSGAGWSIFHADGFCEPSAHAENEGPGAARNECPSLPRRAKEGRRNNSGETVVKTCGEAFCGDLARSDTLCDGRKAALRADGLRGPTRHGRMP